MALMLDFSTELDAVNTMLQGIGQAPVNTLEVSGIGDVARARTTLTRVSRDVQAAGWSWNTDRNYSLLPDTQGFIALPLGALDVDAEDPSSAVVIRRNPVTNTMSLWNGDTNSFAFTTSVVVKIIWGSAFNDLPQSARTYIGAVATRLFQGQTVSSAVLDKINQETVDSAFMLLQRRERATRDTNVYRQNSTVGSFGSRRRF